jgi:putative FmdB family regulatory protein
MPTYEYKCRACDHRFEAFQSMKEDPIEKCPKCGNYSVERLISAGGGLIFKGSGFYITDYRKDSYKRDAKKDAPVTSSSSDSTKSTDKPATKPTAKPETKSKD